MHDSDYYICMSIYLWFHSSLDSNYGDQTHVAQVIKIHTAEEAADFIVRRGVVSVVIEFSVDVSQIMYLVES